MNSLTVTCKDIGVLSIDYFKNFENFDTILFYLSLNEFHDVDEFVNFLNVTEKDRKQKFFFKRDEHLYILSRTILKLFPSRLLNIPANQIEIAQKNDHSKPYYSNPKIKINFNIAHSDKYLLIGFSNSNPIGVDIERRKRNFHPELIVQNYFCKDENELFNNAENKEEAFLRIWTRKEAFVKLIGGQLLDYLLHINVANNYQQLQDIPFDVPYKHIEITNFIPENGIICSYAVPEKNLKSQIFALNQKILKSWFS